MALRDWAQHKIFFLKISNYIIDIFWLRIQKDNQYPNLIHRINKKLHFNLPKVPLEERLLLDLCKYLNIEEFSNPKH